MADESSGIVAIHIPQVNVNDEEVTLVGWRVADGGRAAAGEALCEIETSKSVEELPAPAAGVLRQAARVGETVRVGGLIGYIGPSAEAIDRYLLTAALDPSIGPRPTTAADRPDATAGAVELARLAGVDLARLAGQERIRRADVERYIAERRLGAPSEAAPETPAAETLPPVLQEAIEERQPLSDHQWSIAQHLAATQAHLVVSHAVMAVTMTAAGQWIETRRKAGVMTSPLPILVKAAAAAVKADARLASFRLNRRVFRYRQIDIAFTARSHDGLLVTPVVRCTDSLGLDEVAARCIELGMAAFRGKLTARDSTGACLTVSLLADQPIRLHIGLQNAYQSAILTAGAIRDEVRIVDGQVAAVPTWTLVLSYDHGLMDGWDAALCLDAARQAVENLQF